MKGWYAIKHKHKLLKNFLQLYIYIYIYITCKQIDCQYHFS